MTSLNLLVSYEVQPVPLVNSLDFVVRSITGKPTFIEVEDYKIKNMDLALYMVEETLNMAKNAKVLGSGFKVLGRKNPKLEIRPKYMFLYDSATKSEPPVQMSNSEMVANGEEEAEYLWYGEWVDLCE